MDEAYEFISLNNNLNTTIEGLKRVDHPDYPPYALREALLNAIVHRDYDYSGSILINIYEDRIEFVSIGGLVKGMSMQDILGGVSQSRNMVLANVFYRLKLIESYGTGIRRIIESYEGCLEQPVFAPAPASFVVTLPKIIEVPFSQTKGTNREQILTILETKKEITRKEVESVLNCSKFTAINLINELLKENLIEKSGSGPSVTYKLK